MTALMLMSSPWAAIGGSTGELIDDAIITSKVKASLVADPTVSALDIIEFCISNQDAFTVAMATWNSG
jgi:hypothetical protein